MGQPDLGRQDFEAPPVRGAAPMTGAAAPGVGSRLWVYLQVALAALLFMAITQLNQTVVTRGLALLGARTDVPSIVEVIACGKRYPTSPAALFGREGSSQARLEVCRRAGEEEPVDVVATVPSGQASSLLVNGTRQRWRRVSEARVVFKGVQLRPGANSIAVVGEDEDLSWLRADRSGTTPVWTAFGWIATMDLGAPIIVAAGEARAPIRRVGGWQSPQSARLLFIGPPSQWVPLRGAEGALSFDRDGLAFLPMNALPPGTPLLDETDFRRKARLTRMPSGDIQAEVEACLPTDQIFVRWAERGALGAREFITAITGIELVPFRKGTTGTAGSLYSYPSGKCTLLRAKAIYSASLPYRSGGSFLASPADTLVLAGFGERLDYSEPPAAAQGNAILFRGSIADPRQTLQISPDEAKLAPELAPRPPPGAKPASAPSPLGAAWENVRRGLPVWLQALFYGIVGVAPIILLILVVERKTPRAATGAAQALAGLYTLLLLALAAAAQPLLFQLFYRFTDSWDLWMLLNERRADYKPSYLEPYGAIAIAVAVMLVPFLRSAGGGPRGRPPLVVPILCALASALAVVALVAALILQVLPWARVEEKDRILLILRLLELGVADIGWITAAVFAGGILLAWIPVYWAFRAISPRGRFLYPSVLAGAAAIILPVFAYLVEAGRVLLGRPSPDFGDGDASLLSLAGAALLPFLLFFLLLRAFREIMITVAPPAAAPAVKRYGRTSILLLASVLLVVPELALEAASPSPADMGIIEILSIFRSLALGVAVFAAMGLLVSPKTTAAGGPRPHPYHFGKEELAIVGAVFAGCFGLWTGEPLGTLAGIAAGWIAFHHLVVEKEVALPPSPATNADAKALLDYRRESSLLDARRTAVEEKFAKAEITLGRLKRERCLLNEVAERGESRLGVPPGEAKRWLLEFGPGPTPLRNGVRGAVAGLFFATCLQLASSLRGSAPTTSLASWADLARAALADPTYTIAKVTLGRRSAEAADGRAFSPDMLEFIGTLLNGYFLWTVLGFLFGFLFHRVRGDDGFVKAWYFSAGVGAAFFISLLFTAGGVAAQPIRFVPVVIFLLVVGVAVFDARSLSSRQQSAAALPTVYGFRASVGYVSLIGAIATIEPIFKAVKGLLGK